MRVRRGGFLRFQTLLAMLAILLCAAPLIRSFQGMATSTRSARPANIQTSLPPIKVRGGQVIFCRV